MNFAKGKGNVKDSRRGFQNFTAEHCFGTLKINRIAREILKLLP